MPVDRCIRCNLEPNKNDKFCRRCSAPLVNRCTNDGGLIGEPCKKVNEADAVYCVNCGTPTLFHKTGLLPTAYHPISTDDELEEYQQFSHRFFEPG